MATGKVIRFDEIRGYGFVAPDAGGEDVFIHVNDLEFDKRFLSTGTLVDFEVEDSERGPKASGVRLADSEAGTSAAQAGVSAAAPENDGKLSEVLTAKEFREEVTEILLSAAPAITAEQILHIRQRLAQAARGHGWVES